MRFLRYRKNNKTFPGLEENNIIYDLSNVIEDIDVFTLEALLEMTFDIKTLTEVTAYDSLDVPIKAIRKIICIGLNYTDHAKELNIDIPKEPVVFFKATSSICAANDEVELPKNALKTDWEVELGIVIGKKAKYIQEEEAYDYIAGYTIINDISERAFQLEKEGQWTKGKSHDTFCPLGPYLVTKEEVGNEDNLNMSLSVDGKVHQNSNTKNMHYKVPFIVSYLSSFMTLEVGDVISTGTPSGVGMGLKPPTFLKDKQEIIVSIEKLGFQKQKTKAL